MERISKIVLSSLTLVAMNGFAGTAKFTGQGHISHPAEYVEVNVAVKSQCHQDIAQAREGANQAAQRVLELFKSLIDPANPKDAAYTNGGSTTVSSGHYLNNSRELVCVNTFEKTIGITLLTTNLEEFQANFKIIEDMIYGELAGTPISVAEPATFATLDVPVAHLFTETVDKIQTDALRLALKNAKDKFKILSEAECGIGAFSIIDAVEPPPSSNIPNPYAGTRGVPPQTNPTGAPVVFADIWVTKALEVSFDFTSGECRDGLNELIGMN